MHKCTYNRHTGNVIWSDDDIQFIGKSAMAFSRFCVWAAENDVEIALTP